MATPKSVLIALGSLAAFLVPVGVLLAQETTKVETSFIATPGGAVNVSADALKSGAIPPEVLKKMPPEVLKKMQEQAAKMRGQAGPGKPGKPPGKPGDEKKKADEEKKKAEEEKKKKDEGVKPVQRPSTPPEPADPEELKIQPDASGKIKLNFTGQPWLAVLQWLADMSGMSLDWQEVPGDYLNLTTRRGYKLDEVRDMINRHLLARGYTLLRHEEVLSVVKLEKLNPSMVPRVDPEDLDKRDPHEFVKVCFRLDSLLAETAVKELEPMKSLHGKLNPLNATNRLEAIDVVINLLEIRRLLDEEQSPEGQEGLVREFQLEHTRAADVREQLLALLGIESKPARGGPMTPQQIKQMQEQAKRMAQMAAQQGKKPGGAAMPKPAAKVNLVANQRKNSILAFAPPDKMAIIAHAVSVLDVPSNRRQSLLANMSRMQIYRLETIDPEPLVKTLEDVGDLDPNTELKVDEENRAIIAYASLADHATIYALVEKLDGGGRQYTVIPLKTLRAESVVSTIDFMMGGGKKEEETQPDRRRSYGPFGMSYGGYSSRGRRGSEQYTDKFRVQADVRNNSLVLWANQFELAKVNDLLDNLREFPPRDESPNTVRTYRLAAIDPDPVVKTLENMDTLGAHTTLQIDEQNNAIIAFAPPDDHAIIRELVEELDGSSRTLEVIPLRRLEADYVAGTIEMLMVGGPKKEKYQSRYDYYPYSDRMRPQPKDESDGFRVDADVEYNKLLVWANEIELAEVRNFLVKLGEIPAEGGSPDTVRVIDTAGGEELAELIERIRRTWPSMAPNMLFLVPPEEPEEPQPDATPKLGSGEEEDPQPASPPKDSTTQTGRPLFRFVQLRQEDAGGDPSQGSATGAAGGEVPQVPGEGDGAAEVPQDPPKVDPGAEGPPPHPRKTGGKAEASGESPQDPGKTADKFPPVRISWGPDGRLIIASQDTKALDLLQDMLSRLAPPRRDYQVFQLRYAMAYWVALNLEDFFEEEDKQPQRRSYYDFYFGYSGGGDTGGDTRARLSKRRPLKFIADSDTNTILVLGADPTQLRTISELIKLYDTPEPPDTQSVRKTEVFHLSYSKAQVVADAVKDVYRDLLSPNDKRLQGGKEQRVERSYTYNLGDSGTAQKMPRWKGQLSIGVDELANALLVSAPAYLFEDVSSMINELDKAAKPVSTVRVLQIDGRLSAAGLQEKLSEILGGKSSGRPSGKPPGPRPGEGGPPRPPGPRPVRSGGSYNSR